MKCTIRPLKPDYAQALAEQQGAVREVLAARGSGRVGILFLGEHQSVYTLGSHANRTNLLVPRTYLEQLGIPLVETNRGGDITYHGPGQLVGYPILDLQAIGLGARRYIEALEATVIRCLRAYGVEGFVDPNAAGVWLAPSRNLPLRKICAMGVHISQSVSMHGFALNVNTDLHHFARINPCGFTDRAVTSLANELGHTTPMEEVVRNFTLAFAEEFGLELEADA